MSSLLKTNYMNIDAKAKRVINTNELAEKRIAMYRERIENASTPEPDEDGFTPGIIAREVDPLDALMDDNDGETILIDSTEDENGGEGFVSGLIKARPADEEISEDDILARATAKGDEIVARAIKQAQDVIRDAQTEAEQVKRELYAKAENEGYAEGQRKANAELEKIKADFEKKKAALEAEYEQYFDNLEIQLVDKITDIYSHIFAVDLSKNKNVLLHLIATTMRRIEGTKSFLIHVSSADAEFVRNQKNRLVGAATIPGSIVEIIEDIGLNQNECLIETQGGIFDCSLDTEMKELVQRIRILSYDK